MVNGFYRAHIYASVDGTPLELGFADIEIVPDSLSKAAYRKIDRSLYAPLKYGRSLSVNFQIQPGALVPPVKTLATGLLFPHIALDATSVYWTDTYAGTVQKAPLTGGPVTTLASGLFNPDFLAVSPTGVYFSTFTGGALADTVQSVPLTGGTPQVIASGLPNVWGVAVDGASVYWSQSQGIASGSVQKAPLAGGPVTVLGSAADGVYEPASLSVTGNTLYWNDFNRVSIRSAPTAGGAPPATVVSTNNWTYALTTDASSVFWTQPDPSVPGNWLLRTAPLADGATTTLVASPSLDYGSHTFASDGANVYYAILSGGTVDASSATGYALMKVPVGGGAPTTIVSRAEGLNQYPTSLALDGARVYWAAAGNVYSAPK